MSIQIERYINKFTSQLDKDNHSRYKSFDHCKNFFNILIKKDILNDKDIDQMSLLLFSYLSSWGMLRNSFIMYKDYLFHKGAVEILLKEKYKTLHNFNPINQNSESIIKLILELKKEINNYYFGKKYYDGREEYVVNNKISDTLISKIILGTLSCVPAFDRYVRLGLRGVKIPASFSKNGLKELNDYVINNKDSSYSICKTSKSITKDTYPIMKLVDICLWEYGKEIWDKEHTLK